MKTFKLISSILLGILMFSTGLKAQSTGDYRSALSGLWTEASTWEVYNGSAWVPATTAPTGAGNILVDDTVSVSSASVTVSGYVKVEGNGVLTVGASGELTFGATSTYEHARNIGTIPMATWAVGSTAKFTGVSNSAPGNRIQSFSNIIWDNPAQTANLNMGWNGVTITGTITINSTGTGRWYFAGPTTGSTAEFTINGNIIHNGGNFAVHGTGNGNTTIIIHHFGNVTANAGNFSICRGSQAGTGTTTWYLHGNLILNNTETQNSNTAGAKFVFAGEDFRTLVLNNVTYGGGGLPLAVDSNAVVMLGNNVIGGNGNFTMADYGGVITSHPDGLNGNLATTGVITLSPKGNYGFAGSTAQVTGAMMQDTANGIYIENSAGVTLSGNLLVTDWIGMGGGSLATGGNNLTYGANVTLNYEANAPQTTSDVEFPATGGPKNLRVTNPAGVTLHADRTINGVVQMDEGMLNLNGKTLTLGADAMLEENNMAAVTGTSGKIVTTRNLNAPSAANPGKLGLEISSAANLGSTLIERYHDARTGNGNQSIKRVFRIVPALNTGLNATLRIYYKNSELNSIPEQSLVMFSSANGVNGWNLTGGTVDTGMNFVTVSGLNSFSYHTLASSSNPLPVELTSFTAVHQNNTIVLNWSTATERENRGWDIEKKTSGVWEAIGFVEGRGTTLEQTNYQFTDVQTSSGTASYRLKQIDFDGTTSYSNIVEVDGVVPGDFALMQNYPNPFNPATKITYAVPSGIKGNVTIKVFDVMGKLTAVIDEGKKEAGVYSVEFNAAGLASGMYIYQLSAGNVVLTKTMMLLK